jgi:uncharacterized repeat protein (TIGR03837 family)
MSNPLTSPFKWDIFCHVIDNLGDLGLCWRLSADLARRGHLVRLWVDESGALEWMAPGLHPAVQVLAWRVGEPCAADDTIELGDVVIAAFSCELDAATLAALGARARAGRPCLWINLEYLSAEGFSERAHGRPAPLLGGTAAGAPRLAFYPGFTAATGGLLREPQLLEHQATFDRRAWLTRHGIEWSGQKLLSMFCYESPMMGRLIEDLARGERETLMLVCAGRGAQAVRDALAPVQATHRFVRIGNLTLHFLPFLTQSGYDRLLWSCDLNFVRGEDSLVRAIWAGQAFVWHIYPQQDRVHRQKLIALLDSMRAPPTLCHFTGCWNGLDLGIEQDLCAGVPIAELAQWSTATRAWRDSLIKQPDLASQLIQMAMQRS